MLYRGSTSVVLTKYVEIETKGLACPTRNSRAQLHQRALRYQSISVEGKKDTVVPWHVLRVRQEASYGKE